MIIVELSAGQMRIANSKGTVGRLADQKQKGGLSHPFPDCWIPVLTENCSCVFSVSAIPGGHAGMTAL
jgi:hypothetical protein